jgi:hypothetical protein
MIGVYYDMVKIKPTHVDRDAARALIIEPPTMTEYEHLETQNSMVDPITTDQHIVDERSNYSEVSDSSLELYSPPENLLQSTKNNCQQQQQQQQQWIRFTSQYIVRA